MYDLIRDDDNVMLRMIHIISLLNLFSSRTTPHSEVNTVSEVQINTLLNRLILWTSEHYMEQITVEDAASVLHFSKSYFCRFFKANTKITYLTYLNQVRICQAAYLLRTGKSVAFSSNACGFSNVSYFITLFRDFFGCTPGEFIRNH